jgi:hypothetical protein
MKLPALALLVLLAPSVARADDPGCVEGPVLTPATLTASDLRCFPLRTTFPRVPPKLEGRTSVLPIVLGVVGAAAIGTSIGFGIGAASLTDDATAIRVDHAVANVALTVGVTALVTAIVLALVHR